MIAIIIHITLKYCRINVNIFAYRSCLIPMKPKNSLMIHQVAWKNNWLKLKSIFSKYFNFKVYRAYDWLHLMLLPVNACIPFFIIATGITSAMMHQSAAFLWFSNLDTWTHQSNSLVSVFVWLWFLKPKHAFFRTNSYLVWITTYIFITGLYFNTFVILQATGHIKTINVDFSVVSKTSSLPNHIAYIPKDQSPLAIFLVTSTIFLHLINPILFVTFGITKMMLAHKRVTKNYFLFLFFGLLYPTIYMIYLIYIPWSGFQDNGKISYSTYGDFTQTKYNPNTWLWFPPLYVTFMVFGSIIWFFNYCGFKTTWRAWHKMWQKKEDQKLKMRQTKQCEQLNKNGK